MRLAYQAVTWGIACAAALTAAGCAIDPAVNDPVGFVHGSWTIERGNDRVTTRPISSASVETIMIASSNETMPFGTAETASLQLACFKGSPIVRVAFAFKVGSTRNAEFGYAFDQKPGHQPRVRFADFRSLVIEDPQEVARFAGELVGAQKLYVRIRSLNRGRTSAEFAVDGGGPALDSAFADCPIAAALAKEQEQAKTNAKGKAKTGPAAKTAALAAAPAPIAEPEDDEARTASDPPRWRTEEEAAFDQIKGWLGRDSRRNGY